MDVEAAPSSAQEIAAGLQGGAQERELAYTALEEAAEGRAVALVAACVKPLTDFVLCAPASKIATAEWCEPQSPTLSETRVLVAGANLPWRSTGSGHRCYCMS